MRNFLKLEEVSSFFLINEALEVSTYESFKDGMLKLNSIDKKAEHIFNKNISIYNLEHYASLFSSFQQEEQIIVQFFEQLNTIEEEINTEKIANTHCGTDINGFLGIDYLKTSIENKIKKVSCNITYDKWLLSFASNFSKLSSIVSNIRFSSKFEKEFENLNDNVQESIINGFFKAKSRGLKTPFYPDTKIIKDVSLSNGKCTVMELRIYSPVALRVYFNESKSFVNVVSIEQKSNPNQTNDIKNAEKILIKM